MLELIKANIGYLLGWIVGLLIVIIFTSIGAYFKERKERKRINKKYEELDRRVKERRKGWMNYRR